MKRNFAKRTGGPPSHLKRMAANVATDLMKNYFTPSGIETSAVHWGGARSRDREIGDDETTANAQNGQQVPHVGVLVAATDGGGETTANGQVPDVDVLAAATDGVSNEIEGGETAANGQVPDVDVLAAAATDGGGDTAPNAENGQVLVAETESDEIVALSAPAVTTKSTGGGKTAAAATNTEDKRRAPISDEQSRNEEAPTTEVVLDLSDCGEKNGEPRRKRNRCGAAKRRAGYRHWRANGGGGGSSAQQPFTYPGPMTAQPFNYNNNFPQMAPFPCMMMMMMPVMPMGMPFCPYPPPPPKN